MNAENEIKKRRVSVPVIYALWGIAAVIILAAGLRVWFGTPEQQRFYVLVPDGVVATQRGRLDMGESLNVNIHHPNVFMRSSRQQSISPDGASAVAVLRQADPKYVMVDVARPVSDNLKVIRLSIEQNAQGADRARFMRKIVPVVPVGADLMEEPSKGGATATFCNDLIYIRDNFGGVALLIYDTDPPLLAGFGELMRNCAAYGEFTLN